MHSFARIVDAIDRLTKSVAVILASVLTMVVLAQVFFRKVLNSSLQWSDELSVVLMIWLVFIGAAIVMRNWEHISISIFVNLLPIRSRRYLIVFAKIATIAFLALLFYYGVSVFNATFHANILSLGLSTKWAKLAVPVGGVLMLVFAVYAAARDVVEIRRGNLDHFKRTGFLPPE